MRRRDFIKVIAGAAAAWPVENSSQVLRAANPTLSNNLRGLDRNLRSHFNHSPGRNMEEVARIAGGFR
jgi:hypothetical protein